VAKIQPEEGLESKAPKPELDCGLEVQPRRRRCLNFSKDSSNRGLLDTVKAFCNL
jgi:hypothetical protein